ncbi:MAG: glycosyltransferase, partial [Duncaniella sp.]|nr:glycosyltransferase [Duncaniella sp.]
MISVIIPAYNAQAYLRECLESVLAQSFSDWEVIVVDDGSTDSTAAIAQSFSARDSRVRVLSTVNRGVSAARNAALGMARGEWVTFLDSDDLLPPGAL